MTDTDPPWLATARAQIGQLHDGPDVPRLAREVGEIFPEYAEYARGAGNATPWCGIFVSWCFAKAGIRPVSTADGLGFMWAQRWRHFGREVTTPQLGDVLVFAHHVTFYVGEDGDHYFCLGGNQSDAVTITNYRKSNCEAILRPPAVGEVQKPTITPSVTTSDSKSAKGSWYSQFEGKYSWVDTGDEPGSNALGVPDAEQGIALPTRAALGHWFDVTAPNGVTLRLRQTDVGPGARTGRGIDISAVAAERFGYTPRNFPTDGTFSWRPASESAPVPNQPPVVLPPSRPGMDPDILKQLLETIVPIVVAAAKQPEVQSAFKLLLPKVLGALGMSVPGIGIIGMVASFVIPALLPDLMGSPTQTSAGVAAFASSAGVFGIGLVNQFKSLVDKIGDRVRQ